MELILEIILGLIILTLLVVAHELGHAVTARRNGVNVEEFGIGFPPQAWVKKMKNGTVFSLNWLPLGGFVKLQGEHDAADKKGDYGAVSFWKKTKILLAGVLVNWLVAAVLISGLALTGLPKIINNQFTIAGDTTYVRYPVELSSITKNYPAEKAGLEVGDKIIRFAGEEVSTPESLIKLSEKNIGKSIDVIYDRDGTESTTQVQLLDDSSSALFGAGLSQNELIKSTWSAPIVGVVSTAQFTWTTIQGIGDLFGDLFTGIFRQLSSDASVREQASSDLKAVSDSVAGPVGILGTIFPAAERAGLTQLVLLTAVISISLAVMNILPIPALDGGRWLTMALFKLTKKKLTKSREERIQTIGFMVLMGLVVLITIADVVKLL